MTTITVLQNQTIYDLAMKYYGGQEGVFDITKINSINFSTVLVPGQQLVIDETKRAAIERTNRKPISNIASTIYRATITGGQSVYDLATQHYGSVDALFALFKTSGVGFKTTLKGGDRLAMDRQNIVNTEYANYFEGSKRRINTYKKVATPGDGIGTWGIEFDFIVS